LDHWSVVEPLSEDHDLTGFTCGDDPMDTWLNNSAQREHKRGSCRVHVCKHHVVGIQGFFALASHEVRKVDYPGDAGGLTVIPSILLARLGRHVRLVGENVGVALVMEALGVAVAAADMVGSRLLIVHAKHEDLAGWYSKMGFRVSRSDPLRLSMKLATAGELVNRYRASLETNGG
jgi:hypothetical protein